MQTSNRQPWGPPVWSVIDAIPWYVLNTLWPHLMGPQYIITSSTLSGHWLNGTPQVDRCQTKMRTLILVMKRAKIIDNDTSVAIVFI